MYALYRLAPPFKRVGAPKDHDGKIEYVFADFKVRAQQLTKVLVRDQRHIGCQASGAFDAGEKSADEDSIDADMNECSEHFFTVHEEVRGEWIEIQVQYIHCHSVCACR